MVLPLSSGASRDGFHFPGGNLIISSLSPYLQFWTWRWNLEGEALKKFLLFGQTFSCFLFTGDPTKIFLKNAQVLPNLVEATAYFLLRPDLPPSLFSRVTFSLNDDDD